MNTKKTKIIIVMMIAVLFMSIGYALLYTRLDIKGISNITDTWGIEITNITSAASGRAYNVSAPTYSGTTATFNVGVKEPGDSMILNITVKNTGSLDAVLESIDTTTSGSYVINYEILGIQSGTRLLAGATKSFQIQISFDINATEIPNDPVKELVVNLNYIQDDGQTLTPTDPSIEGQGTLATTVLLSNDAKSDSSIDFSKGSTYTSGYTETHPNSGNTTTFTEDKSYCFSTGYTFDNTTGLYRLSGTIVTGTWSSMEDKFKQYPYTNHNTSAGGCGASSNYIYKMFGYNSSTIGVAFHYGRSSTYLSDNGEGLYYTSTNTEGGKRVYYFRGNVKNNYVSFAGTLWRIVRINEDGSVRLITDENVESSAFNSNGDNAYIGYMYGATGATTYELAHANTNSSIIKKTLDTWYTSKLSSYASYLADAGFCNNRKLFSGTGYGNATTGVSLYWASEYLDSPQFSCPQTDDLFTTTAGSKGNKKLTNPIGLLSVDEVVYAGGSADTNEENIKYYLNNSSSFWTMTPSGVFAGGTYMYMVGSDGSLAEKAASNSFGVRPVINLKASVKPSSGDGSSGSPYVIK